MPETSFITTLDYGPYIRGGLVLLIGIPLLSLGCRLLSAHLKKTTSAHYAMLARKAAYYLGILLLIATALLQMKFNLTAILGAAGIFTLAIGFAAQTTLSNLISGIFLISEKSFEVGDLIDIGGTRGIVYSIDLLSVKVRTPDNLFVRLPNEQLIKSPLTNITKFPIRRMDIKIGVAYREDIARVMDILRDIANKNPYCLDEPPPLLLCTDFNTSSIDILLGLWFEKTHFLLLKNSIMHEIKTRFDAEGIEIPFPHLTLYTGSETAPLPITQTPPKP